MFIIIAGYTALTLLFNSAFIKEIFLNHRYYSLGGDTLLTQYFGEWFYRNLITLHNPFSYNNDILYPFGTPTVFAEGGFINSLFFVFLRPFFTPHTSLLIIVLLSLFFAGLTMYLLLRKLKVDNYLSFLFGAVYAFAPFVSVRIQYHFNYVYHYLFSLIALLIICFIQSNKPKQLLWYSILLGLSIPLLIFNTFYYFVIYVLFMSLFLFYFLLVNKKIALPLFIKQIGKVKYLFISFIISFVLMLPMFLQIFHAYELKDHRGQPHVGFPGGTYEFSAQVQDLFIPSEFNPFYGKIAQKISPSRQSIEQIIYPGILVLIGVCLYLFLKKKKPYLPLFLTGLTFFILSLGPKFPVYALLHRLPVLSMMRAPVRYGFMMMFVWTILAAFAFNQFIKKKTITVFALVILLVIFLIDQSYAIKVKPQPIQLPLQSYQYIKNDVHVGVVMELPYVIQDGFLYWGRVFYSYPMIGQLIHHKPIIGGYLARINPYKLNYYMTNPFLSYYGSLVDDQRKKDLHITKPADDTLKDNSEFLNIRYILVKRDLPDYKTITNDLLHIGYKLKNKNDNGFTFFIKDVHYAQPSRLNIGKEEAQKYLFGSWSKPEQTHRWIDGNAAGILLSSKDTKPKTINFHAVAYKVKRPVSVYINGEHVKNIMVDVKPMSFRIEAKNIKSGLNKIELIVKGKPLPKSPAEDSRNLSIALADFYMN